MSTANVSDGSKVDVSTEIAAAQGNPAVVGLPAFMVGAFALALYLVGFIPSAGIGATMPIIMTATSVGLFVAATWAARLGQSASASIFAIFGGFWLSYGALVLGLNHDWFGILSTDVARAQELFQISWLIIMLLLTVSTLGLPSSFTWLFLLVDLTLVLLFLGTLEESSALLKAGGVAVFAFGAIGAYLYVATMLVETVGRPLPLGRPMMRARR